MAEVKPKLRREVIVLSLASFFNDAASEMIFPLLPLFIITYLGGTPFIAGTIEGTADALSAILKYVAGRLSDRMPVRKPFIVSGYGLAALARLLIAAAVHWPTVLLARLVDRTGKGIRSAPRDAMIADVTPPEQRGRAFGFHRALDHTGAIVGPLLATMLLRGFGLPLRTVFYAAVVPALIGVMMLLFALKEQRREIHPRKTIEGGVSAPLPPAFKTSIISIALFALANSSDIFLLVQANRAGVTAATLPLLWSAHHILKAVLSERAGHLSDRIDRRWLLVSGWLLYAAIYFVFPLGHSTTFLLTLFVLYALPFALTEGAERAWVVAPVEQGARGRAFGIYYLVSGVCTLFGTLAFGAIYDHVNNAWAFWFGAALATMAAVSVMLNPRRTA